MKELPLTSFLVTGAAGFLGAALVEKLLDNKYVVIGVDKREKGFLSNKVLNSENFTFLKADISNNFSESLNGFDIDGIFHLASQKPSSNDLTYQDFYKGNVETTLNVIDFARSKDIKFVLYTSTGSIFGKQPKEKYINENTTPTPTTYYGLTKYIAERLLDMRLKDARTKVVIVRYPSIFGKNNFDGIAYAYYQLAKKDQDMVIYNKGERYRNILHVLDATDALLRLIENFHKLGKCETFAAGSKNSLKMIEIAQIIKELLGSNSKIVSIDRYSSTDWDVFIDISKIQRVLRFNPISTEKGLKFYIEEMKNEI